MNRIKLDNIDWGKMGGNILFSLLVFIIMVDPTNSVLHLKDILFILLVGYNILFFKPDFSLLPLILGVYIALMLSLIFSEMQATHIDMVFFIGMLKAYAPLILLLWVRHYDILKLSIAPAALMGVIITIIYIAVASSELIEFFVYKFVSAHNDMIKMSERHFLGFKIYGMYYKSMVTLLLPYAWCTYHLLYGNRRHRLGLALICVLLTFAFFTSGTRSTMLVPLALVGVLLFSNMNHYPRARYFIYPVAAFFCVFFLLILTLLASDKGESSNFVKYGHLTSFADLFTAHPEYLLWGQGIGTNFYSIGFHRMTNQTEWTYLELLRGHGIFIICFLILLLYPVRTFWQHRKDSMTFTLTACYFMFLLIAGTNPLLSSSTGMIIIVTAYSIAYRLRAKNATMNTLPQ